MHIPSLIAGFVGAYALAILVLFALIVAEYRRYKRSQRTAQSKALDQLLADVAIRYIERPVDVRKN